MRRSPIWVSFLRTGHGPELCPFKKKVWKLAVTKHEEQPLFFQLFMRDLFRRPCMNELKKEYCVKTKLIALD